MSYSLSHAAVIRWALEMEMGHLKVTNNDPESEIMVYLKERIKELKELETNLSLINSKGAK